MTDTALDRLAAEYWGAWLERHPTGATVLGDRRFDDRLPDESVAGRATWRAELDGLEARMRNLAGGDPVTRAALAEALMASRAFLDADLGSFNIDPLDGPQVALLNIPSYQSVRSPEEERALVARWRAMPEYLDQAAQNLRAGAAGGRTGVEALVKRVLDQLDGLLRRPDADWPLARVESDVLEIIATDIRPAFERYRTTVAELARDARPNERAGLANLPGGAAAYRSLVRAHASVDLEPEDLHAVGLREVERIDAEFVELGARLLRTDGLQATLTALRTDPALHFTTREEIAEVARRSLERASGAIGEWFGRLPKAPCEVVVMAPHEEKHSTIAYYREPAGDGSRPGRYYINTYAPETRPRYEAETLAFHESVPGHHLQIAIAQELPQLPAFRRFLGSTAYVEGWGLYTERLSDEMGLLSGDLDRFGVLSFDAWRASRLVVDTGIHALGWTRDAAIDFMTRHTALGTNNIINEVDRYIACPAQALAYKVGQLELLRLRAEARDRLGSAFDIRAFHDAVLSEGALPLPVLRHVVEGALAVTDGAA